MDEPWAGLGEPWTPAICTAAISSDSAKRQKARNTISFSTAKDAPPVPPRPCAPRNPEHRTDSERKEAIVNSNPCARLFQIQVSNLFQIF